MVNAVLPGMRQQRDGLIINFGSLAAGLPIPLPRLPVRVQGRGGHVLGCLRLEVKHLGIAVTVVEPGMVATHQGERFTQLKVAGVIGDYAEQEARAVAVMEEASGRARARRRWPRPSCGSSARPLRPGTTWSAAWYARLARIMPPSAVESLMARRFQLAK
jgi:short-subunit dehydrogenase